MYLDDVVCIGKVLSMAECTKWKNCSKKASLSEGEDGGVRVAAAEERWARKHSLWAGVMEE